MYAISAILQPDYGSDYHDKVNVYEILKYLWCLSRAYSSSKTRKPVFCESRGCYPRSDRGGLLTDADMIDRECFQRYLSCQMVRNVLLRKYDGQGNLKGMSNNK